MSGPSPGSVTRKPAPGGEAPAAPVVVAEGLFTFPPTRDEPPALLASRCEVCGASFFPRRSQCPRCADGGRLVDSTLGCRGTIYACTVVRVPSPVGIEPPYAYGYVDIPKDGVRVFALFTGASPESFAPGQEVELVLEPVRRDDQGRDVIGYKFRPAGVRGAP